MRAVKHLICCSSRHDALYYFFFFNDTATTEIYTLSLHDALPIFAYTTMRKQTAHRVVIFVRRTRYPATPATQPARTRGAGPGIARSRCGDRHAGALCPRIWRGFRKLLPDPRTPRIFADLSRQRP